MNKLVLVGLLALAMSVAAVAIKTATARAELVAEEVSGGGTCYVPSKGVTCTVICNGACPAAPSGWILSESIGASGGYRDGVGGRCVYGSGVQGTERMCCYFQDNLP